MIRAFIVDDEDLARARFITLLENSERNIEIAGEAGDPVEAVSAIREVRPDVVFLDIQMPQLDGFDVVELLGEDRPDIVFVTAYDEYAIKAFEVHAVDYLTKPVRLERLKKSIDRLGDSGTSGKAMDALMESRKTRELKRISAQSARGIQVIELDHIHYFEAEDKLLYVLFDDKKMRVDFTLDELEKRLNPDHFVRIHRSYLAHAAHIKSIEPWFNGNWRAKMANGSQLTIARRRVADVKKVLGYG